MAPLVNDSCSPFSADAAFRVLGAVDDQMAIALFVEAWRDHDWTECKAIACSSPEGRVAWQAEVAPNA